MKTKNQTWYICEKCGEAYQMESEALSCEERSIAWEKGVKVGDVVRVTRGEGSGYLAKVTNVSVVSKYWGHYQWERYWHTIALTADLIDYPGSRTLLFDSYEPLDD